MKFKRTDIIWVVILVLGVFVTWLVIERVPWSGFFEYTTKTTEERENYQPQSKLTKVTKEIQHDKTLWDWLQLAGIPFVLAGGGYLLNQREQERDEKRKEAEQNRAAENLREEALQTYFDRISELLLEHNLGQTEQNNKPAQDIARARTLTLLSRLGGDGQRKAPIVRLLREAKLIMKEVPIIKLDGANLSRADLRGEFLIGVDLSWANLSYANLQETELGGANLTKANLKGANLESVNLTNANLSGTDLSGVNLSRANLRDADLSGAKNLIQAKFCRTTLPNGTVSNRDCGK